MFEREVFRKQMYCIEESTCDIVGIFQRSPQWFGARRIVPPLAPLARDDNYSSAENSDPENIQIFESELMVPTLIKSWCLLLGCERIPFDRQCSSAKLNLGCLRTTSLKKVLRDPLSNTAAPPFAVNFIF